MRIAPLIVWLIACNGNDDPSTPETGITVADTDTDTDTGTDTDTDTDTDGNVLIPCRALDYQSTCRGVNNGYDVCADYFGDYEESLVRPQCELNGTWDADPCTASPFPVGACVFDAAGTDLCYIQHVAAPTADDVAPGLSFWEAACPAVGGTWIPG